MSGTAGQGGKGGDGLIVMLRPVTLVAVVARLVAQSFNAVSRRNAYAFREKLIGSASALTKLDLAWSVGAEIHARRAAEC